MTLLEILHGFIEIQHMGLGQSGADPECEPEQQDRGKGQHRDFRRDPQS